MTSTTMDAPTAGVTVTSRTENARPTTLGEVIDAFMAGYAGRDQTLPSRLRWWKAKLGDQPIVGLADGAAVEEALRSLAEEPATHYYGRGLDGRPILRSRGRRSGATLNRYRQGLASVIRYARRKRLIPRGWTSPLAGLEREPESSGRLRYLSKEEYARLLAVARASRWPKLWVLIRLAVESGVRRGGLTALRWGDVDLEAGRAIVERSKNGSPHVIVLLPETVTELKRFAGRPEEFVFSWARAPLRPYQFRRAFELALVGARISDFTFHGLRHTHASWLARQGASLLQIADSMNHRSLAMVKRYSHLAVDDRARLLERVFAQ
jgi:integrase